MSYNGGMVEDRWTVIDSIAASLGVGSFARAKWRQRGVAHKWRLPILQEAARQNIELTTADMEPPPGGRVAA